MSGGSKSRSRRAARQRGSDFEKRVAARLDGEIYRGQDGDVDARGYRIECKYRTGLVLESPRTLRDWHEQINAYRANPKNASQPFALAYSGGASYHREIWVSIPIADFDRLTRFAAAVDQVAGFRDKLVVINQSLDDLLKDTE